MLIRPINNAKPVARPRTIAFIGDSITLQCGPMTAPAGTYVTDTTYNNNKQHTGYWTFAGWKLRQRLWPVKNAGIGGNTTAQMLARLDSDILSLNPLPGYCVVEGGTNDLAGSIAETTVFANLRTISERLIAANVLPVLMTVPPNFGTPNTRGTLHRLLKQYARDRGVPLADVYAACVDASSGGWRSGMSGDGVHPNSVGAAVMGSCLYDTLSPVVPPLDVLPGSNVEGDNKVTNPLSLGDQGGGLATGWTSRFTNAAFAKVARTDGLPGEWQQISNSGGAIAGDIYLAVALATGDVYAVEMEYERDNDWSGLSLFGITVNPGDNTKSYGLAGETTAGYDGDPSPYLPLSGVLRSYLFEFTGDSGNYYLFVRFQATAGTLRVGRVAVRKVN